MIQLSIVLYRILYRIMEIIVVDFDWSIIHNKIHKQQISATVCKIPIYEDFEQVVEICVKQELIFGCQILKSFEWNLEMFDLLVL